MNFANLSVGPYGDWTSISFEFQSDDPPRRVSLVETREWRVVYRRNGWWTRWCWDRRARRSALQLEESLAEIHKECIDVDCEFRKD